MAISLIFYRIILIIFVLSAMVVSAHESPQEYIEENKEDELKDAEAISPKGNFVAVPIPISNPTVGNGLQAALFYLHPKKKLLNPEIRPVESAACIQIPTLGLPVYSMMVIGLMINLSLQVFWAGEILT